MPAEPSLKRKGPEDAEPEKMPKRPRKSGKTVKSAAYVEESDDVPLQSQTVQRADVGKAGPPDQPVAGPSGDKGKDVDRSSQPPPVKVRRKPGRVPVSCAECRRCGHCHSVLRYAC